MIYIKPIDTKHCANVWDGSQVQTDRQNGYLWLSVIKICKLQYLDGSRVKADPFTRGACAEASAGAITCIIWCNTSQYTPIQALSPRPRAAALIPSSPSLGNLRKSFASDVNIHVSNPRVPSPASNALSLALKTEEATRGDR